MNFTFLNNFFLYFLPLIALPIVIHLLFRKKRKILYSDTQLIRELLTQKKIFHRWQKYLLMMLRALILLFLILAFSQPWLTFYGLNPADEISCVFLFDVSYSMNYSTLGESELQKSKKVATSLLEKLPKNSKVAIVAYSDILELSSPLITDKKHTAKLINSLSTTYRKTMHSVGLNTAYEILTTNNNTRTKNILWFTDGASHGFLQQEPFELKDTNIIVITDDTPKKNASVVSVTQNVDELLEVELESFGLSDNLMCLLYENDTELGSIPISITQGRNKITTPWKISGGDKQKRYILKLKGDNLKEDNNYYFLPSKTTRQHILIVDGNPQPGYKSEVIYLVAAISSLGYSYKTIPFHQFLLENLDNYTAVFLSNYIPETPPPNLSDKKIVIFMGDNITTPPEWLKVSWSEKVRKKTGIIPTDTLGELKESFNWHAIVDTFLSITDFSNFDILIKNSDGEPFLISGGNISIFNTTANRSWSDFTSKPFFVPLIKKLLEDKVTSDIYTFVGKDVVIKDEMKIAMLKKNGKTLEVFNNTIPPIEKPGFYELSFYKKALKDTINLVVNVDPQESDLRYEKKLGRYIKDANILIAKRTDLQKIATMITGRDVSVYFWTALLFLVFLENVFLYYLNKK